MTLSVRDKDLTTAIYHDCYLAKKSFSEFEHLAHSNIWGSDNKEIRLRLYSAYGGFLMHLFSALEGCMKRDGIHGGCREDRTIDRYIKSYAFKLLNHYSELIQSGNAPIWVNDLTYYLVDVPDVFGQHFRQIRNRVSHPKEDRAKPSDITMKDFYERYHKFIYLIYADLTQYWSVENIELFDWGDIEEFSLFVHSDVESA